MGDHRGQRLRRLFERSGCRRAKAPHADIRIMRKMLPSCVSLGRRGGIGSCAQLVLSKQLHRARLRSLLAHFLGKGHASARGQTGKGAVEHAVAMKIDLAAIAGFEESELAGRIEPRDRSDRLALVLLHLALEPARLILQPPARPLEGVVDRERQIGVALVRRRVRSTLTSRPLGSARRMLTS